MGRKREGWIAESLWLKFKAVMPIACVDLIIPDSRGAVLLGWRIIPPYAKVWALPGGRIRFGEDLATTARRILSTHKIVSQDFYLVGVFPVRFPSRFDITLSLAARKYSGVATADGIEFSQVRWFMKLPKGIGKNYERMIIKWRLMQRTPQLAKFSRL